MLIEIIEISIKKTSSFTGKSHVVCTSRDKKRKAANFIFKSSVSSHQQVISLPSGEFQNRLKKKNIFKL